MRIQFKVQKNTDLIPLEEAVQLGEVVFEKSHIRTSKTVTLWLSTLLRDQTGREIFENDMLCDADNRLYRVIYRNGAFIAQHQEKKEQIDLPLYLLQSNGVVPAKII